MNSGASGAWGNFDTWAERLVRGEVSFDVFAVNVKNDVSRLAWKATKRRRPPYWMGIEDVEGLILQHVWYYAFQHKTREGRVGYDASRSDSAGSYLRWNASQHVQKDLGKARGENMHSHRLFGPPPETLSKTGETPELSGAIDEEERFDDGRRSAALQRITEATKKFVVQNEVLRAIGRSEAEAEARVVSFLMEQPSEVRTVLGIKRSEDAVRFWAMFRAHGGVKDEIKALKAQRKAARAQKAALETAALEELFAPEPPTPEPVVEETPVAPIPETRHPKEEAIACEDHLLVEEFIARPRQQRAKMFRPTRTEMIEGHGVYRSYKLGCRCSACREANHHRWVVWETRKQAREKGAVLS